MSDLLLSGLFADLDVSASLSDRARLQRMLDVEAALAGAESALGVIPAGAAASIRDEARAELYDLAAIASEAAADGNLAIPVVRHLTRRVATRDAGAARYVHWGATSQDIIDTGLVLQLKDALPAILLRLRSAAASAASHARRHAVTPIAGRTWLQQGTPTTFGLKAAGWLDALHRTTDGVHTAMQAALVLQFGGATGTLAALGEHGPAVADVLGARLGLAVPAAPWHAHRDRLASLACALGVAAGTLGKIGRDLALLGQTEVAEAFEAVAEGGGGSSTMPHKRNPVRVSVALAAAVRIPGLVATMLSAMPQEHERGLGGWQAEWETLPEIVRVTAGSARAMADALEGLVVDPARMRANLAATRGLAMAEAVTMALAVSVGKGDAHARVEAACRRAIAEQRELVDILSEDPIVTAVLDRAALERHLTPERYLGAAGTFVDRILALREGAIRRG
jgi:3-carboxy-cis,cis-muconate cycloisomerase